MAADKEKHILIHQTRFMDGGTPIAVRVIANSIDGFEFHKRNATPGLFVNDVDGEIGWFFGWDRCDQQEKQRNSDH